MEFGEKGGGQHLLLRLLELSEFPLSRVASQASCLGQHNIEMAKTKIRSKGVHAADLKTHCCPQPAFTLMEWPNTYFEAPIIGLVKLSTLLFPLYCNFYICWGSSFHTFRNSHYKEWQHWRRMERERKEREGDWLAQ